MSHAIALHQCILVTQGKPNKFVLEPLDFADDCVLSCYGRKGAIFENWLDTLFVDL